MTLADPGEDAIARAREALRDFGAPRPPDDGVHLSIAVSDGAGGIAGVVRALDGAGLDVAALSLVEPSLDDVFIAKTGRHLEGEDAAAAAPA